MRKIRWELDRNEKKMNSKGSMECRMNVPKCVWMLSSAQPFTTRSLLTTSFVVSFLMETCYFGFFRFYSPGMGSGSETLFLNTYFCSYCAMEWHSLLFCFLWRDKYVYQGPSLCGQFQSSSMQWVPEGAHPIPSQIMSQMCRQRGFSAHPEPMWREQSLLTLLGYMGENYPKKCNVLYVLELHSWSGISR